MHRNNRDVLNQPRKCASTHACTHTHTYRQPFTAHQLFMVTTLLEHNLFYRLGVEGMPTIWQIMPFYVVQVVTCIYTMPSWINAHKQQISINIPRECACPPTYTDNHSQGTGCPLTKKSEHVLFGGHFLCLETYCCKSKKTKNRNHLHYVPKGNYKHNYRKGVTLYSRN